MFYMILRIFHFCNPILFYEFLQAFKLEVDPKHADIESLNQKAKDLTKDASPDQSVFVKEPVSAVNKRWDGLLSGISDRYI